MNLLGIDYGNKKIGLAIAYKENSGYIIVGYKTLDNDNTKNLIKKLTNITRKENIEKVVIGLPLGLRGIKTEQTIKTEKFVSVLGSMVDVPVLEEDERMTSALAKKTFNKNTHEESAKIILEGYIEKTRNKDSKK